MFLSIKKVYFMCDEGELKWAGVMRENGKLVFPGKS